MSNTSIVSSGYEAFGRGDIPAVLALFDEGIVWYTPESVEYGGTYTGPAAVGQFFSLLPGHYAELRVTPQQFVEQGDTVVALGTHYGRSHAGTDFTLAFAHVWTVKDGKVTAMTEFFDTATMNAALGLSAPAVAAG